MSAMRLELLGGFQLRSAAGEPIALTAKKARALLAFLALGAGRRQSRERLAALLWMDSNEHHARTSLRQALTVLRRTLAEAGDDVIVADADFVSLQSSALSLDVRDFEQALEQGTAQALQGALGLYRGDLLDGVSADTTAFEQWVAGERERLRAQAVKALSKLFEHQAATGLTDRALETGVRLVALDPLAEEAQRQLIKLYMQSGRTVEALKQYQLFRQSLARQLGVPPAPQTEALYRDIVRLRRTTAAAAEPVPAESQEVSADPAAHSVAELRHATVLLTDLHGFTAFAGQADPELVHTFLIAYRGSIVDLVERNGGAVTNYIGARVMAVFGAPIAYGDDTERAARTALALREQMAAARVLPDYRPAPQIGLASGALFIERRATQLEVSGEPVSLAARIMEQAAAGEVLVTGEVRDALGNQARLDVAPDVSIRAASRPLAVWRLQSLVAPEASLQPFVARESELQQLESALDRCRQSRLGHAVFLRGEAGIGKTRLLEEATRLALLHGFACSRTQVFEFGSGSGTATVPALVCGLLGTSDADAAAAAQRALDAGVVSQQDAGALFDLLDLPVPQAWSAVIDHAARQRSKQSVLAALLREQCRRAPLLLAVEDVHWADAATLECLADLACTVREVPVLFVMTSRPQGDPIDAAWRAGAGDCPLLTVDIGPLDQLACRRLAQPYALDSAAVASCVERSGGNPLFLDQLLRHAARGGGSVPGSVQSIVLARLDRLEPAERQWLQAACVFGQRFTVDQVESVADDSCARERIVQAGLLRPDSMGYLFSHALFQEAIYASLTRSRRQELHARAAQWFEQRDPGLYAQHLQMAENPRAAEAFLDAARGEAGRRQYQRARSLTERGLELSPPPAVYQALADLHADVLRELGET